MVSSNRLRLAPTMSLGNEVLLTRNGIVELRFGVG